jgi:hypothetical protein
MLTKTKIATPLSRKATLVAVNISEWTARKLDKKVTKETNEWHNAAEDAGRYNKLLVAKEHLAELSGLASKARDLHYRFTLPWADKGPRILPNKKFAEFSNAFRELKREFEAAAERFERVYPDVVEEAKRRLNGMFNEADYPDASEIRSRFNLDISVMPFPDADDFRSDLDDDTVADIKRELAATATSVLDNANRQVVEKIVKVVGHMAKKLGEYKANGATARESNFHHTLVDNVRELADILPAFNLTDDPKLAAIAKRIASELCVEGVTTLRENDNVRAVVAKSADDIVKDVEGLFA